MGPLVVGHWRDDPVHALGFVGGFYGTFLATMTAQAILFSSARRLGERFVRIGVRVGVLLLVLFAGLLWTSAVGPRETSPAGAASKIGEHERLRTPNGGEPSASGTAGVTT
jgi:hypothetical protein